MTSFLVVLRAGDGSLHPNWLAGSRDWDLAISYYGLDEQKVFPEASYLHRYRGGKWDGLRDFFASHPDVIERYDYFWLPDDDILTDASSINKLFELMKQYHLELAQPSLTANSYFSYLVTLKCPCFSLRYTTLVEIMAPILTRSHLIKVLPYFEITQSGFGLDLIWHRLTSDPACKAAILDQVSIVHTRPVSGAAAEQLGHQLVSRWKEKEDFMAQWEIHQHHPVVFAGCTTNGLCASVTDNLCVDAIHLLELAMLEI